MSIEQAEDVPDDNTSPEQQRTEAEQQQTEAMRTSSAASAHTVSSVDSAHAALHATVPKPRDHSAMQGGIYDLMRKGLLKQMGFYRDQLEFSIKVRALFDSFDDDGSGSITAQELRKALKNFEIQLSNKEMQGLMARFDQNRDGEIDAEEFENMVKDLIPAPEFDVGAIFLDQKLKSTFAKIDVNGDGSLDKDELQQGLLMLGLEMKDDQLERIIKAADIDGDGTLDYDEFSQFYSKYDTRAKLSSADLDAIRDKWSPPDDVVRDGDPRCVAGAKVVLRAQYSGLRGYRRFMGTGVLLRPCEEGVPGRWYVKFPTDPEAMLHTGGHNILELSFVSLDPDEVGEQKQSQETQRLSELMKISEQAGPADWHDDPVSEERELASFRQRLLHARFSTTKELVQKRSSLRSDEWG